MKYKVIYIDKKEVLYRYCSWYFTGDLKHAFLDMYLDWRYVNTGYLVPMEARLAIEAAAALRQRTINKD